MADTKKNRSKKNAVDTNAADDVVKERRFESEYQKDVTKAERKKVLKDFYDKKGLHDVPDKPYEKMEKRIEGPGKAIKEENVRIDERNAERKIKNDDIMEKNSANKVENSRRARARARTESELKVEEKKENKARRQANTDLDTKDADLTKQEAKQKQAVNDDYANERKRKQKLFPGEPEDSADFKKKQKAALEEYKNGKPKKKPQVFTNKKTGKKEISPKSLAEKKRLEDLQRKGGKKGKFLKGVKVRHPSKPKIIDATEATYGKPKKKPGELSKAQTKKLEELKAKRPGAKLKDAFTRVTTKNPDKIAAKKAKEKAVKKAGEARIKKAADKAEAKLKKQAAKVGRLWRGAKAVGGKIPGLGFAVGAADFAFRDTPYDYRDIPQTAEEKKGNDSAADSFGGQLGRFFNKHNMEMAALDLADRGLGVADDFTFGAFDSLSEGQQALRDAYNSNVRTGQYEGAGIPASAAPARPQQPAPVPVSVPQGAQGVPVQQQSTARYNAPMPFSGIPDAPQIVQTTPERPVVEGAATTPMTPAEAFAVGTSNHDALPDVPPATVVNPNDLIEMAPDGGDVPSWIRTDAKKSARTREEVAAAEREKAAGVIDYSKYRTAEAQGQSEYTGPSPEDILSTATPEQLAKMEVLKQYGNESNDPNVQVQKQALWQEMQAGHAQVVQSGGVVPKRPTPGEAPGPDTIPGTVPSTPPQGGQPNQISIPGSNNGFGNLMSFYNADLPFAPISGNAGSTGPTGAPRGNPVPSGPSPREAAIAQQAQRVRQEELAKESYYNQQMQNKLNPFGSGSGYEDLQMRSAYYGGR